MPTSEFQEVLEPTAQGKHIVPTRKTGTDRSMDKETTPNEQAR